MQAHERCQQIGVDINEVSQQMQAARSERARFLQLPKLWLSVHAWICELVDF